MFQGIIGVALAMGIATLVSAAAPVGTAAEAPLGSPNFQPSAERPVGWRGDGAGRYPGATPPTRWSRTKSGADYSTHGIAWATALPGASVSCPIIVGDRVLVTSELADLACLDKRTGRILWLRSNSEFEGLPTEEVNAEPAFAEKLAPLAAQLAKADDAVVEAINGKQDAAAALKQKRDLEKQINDAQLDIDNKKFVRDGSQSLYGYSGPTPTSDGKHVFVFYTTGVTACYTLDGKRVWINLGAGRASEHGNFSSPLLCGDRLVVWANGKLRGHDAATGKVLWTVQCQDTNSYGSLFRLRSGGELVAGFQSGFFVRVSDGKPIWNKLALGGGGSSTPIVEGDNIIAYNDPGFRVFKIPASTDSGAVKSIVNLKKDGGDWKDSDFPAGNWQAMLKNCIASPLYDDGLIYRLSEGGGLIVNDAGSGEVVYSKVLPMKPKTEYWSWGGASISPCLAGRYLYLLDNQGTSVVVEPGRQYKEVARNTIEEFRDGKSQVQNLSTPVFEGSRMYLRTPGYLYCIGE